MLGTKIEASNSAETNLTPASAVFSRLNADKQVHSSTGEFPQKPTYTKHATRVENREVWPSARWRDATLFLGEI